MHTSNKRKATNSIVGSSSTSKKASNDENSARALRGLSRLSANEKHAILENLIRNPLEDATNLVMRKTESLDKTPLSDQLLKSFGSRSYIAIHQLDRLRCSQQYERVGTVSSDLLDLITEAKRYPPVVRLCLLCRIAGVFSHSVDTGEVFKGISSCGGIQGDLSQDMLEAIDEIDDGHDEEHLEDAKSQLERVDSRLSDYCIDEFKEVIDKLDSMLSGEGGDDNEDDDDDEDDGDDEDDDDDEYSD